MAGRLGQTMMRAGVGRGGSRKLACGGKKYAMGGAIKKTTPKKKTKQ